MTTIEHTFKDRILWKVDRIEKDLKKLSETRTYIEEYGKQIRRDLREIKQILLEEKS